MLEKDGVMFTVSYSKESIRHKEGENKEGEEREDM